jgi:putative SOS response-associated peptidase YedK
VPGGIQGWRGQEVGIVSGVGVEEIGSMCHHYLARKRNPEDYFPEFTIRSNHYQLLLPEKGFWPLAAVPSIRLDDNGEREMVAAEWGFLPSWWKPSDKTPKRASFQRKCVNARSEEVDKKPSFRSAFKQRRCLMPATDFFEMGHYFRLRENRPFALAALWDRWLGADGVPVETCTMLTTSANSAVEAVGNDRMAVVLAREEDYALWLNPDIAERQRLEPLFLPSDPAMMESYPAE